MIKIKSHTEKFQFPTEKAKNFLIEVDVNALSEIINKLIQIISEGKVTFDFVGYMKNSKKDFYNKKWHNKIDYFIVLWLFIIENDEISAIKYIDENVDIEEINDLEFIDIITDVYSEKLSTTQRINFFDKLIRNAKSELKKSNYLMRKAMTYLSLHDIDTFNELINEAANLCDKNYDKNISIADKYNCAKVYSLYGKQNISFIKKSINIYEEFLQNNYFKNNYIIYRHIADNYLDLKIYDEAIINYNKAKKIQSKPEILIELSRAYIRNGNYEEGEETLLTINFDNLINELKLDYLTAYSELCCYKDTDKIDFIIEEFKKLKPISNYYSEYIQKSIVMLYEIKNSKKAPVKREKLWKKLNKIIMAKPNIYGLGIDFNEIVNLFDKKSDV